MHVEVVRGLLLWWRTTEEAMLGEQPVGHVILPCTQLEWTGQDQWIRIRSKHSNEILVFDAETQEEAAEWWRVLCLHKEHCKDEQLGEHIVGRA